MNWLIVFDHRREFAAPLHIVERSTCNAWFTS
jgi:hypothetical protein